MKYAYTTLSLAALALAETHQVQVGPGLSYSPDSLTAAEGDIVQFTFGSGHDVVSGTFDSPCSPDGLVSSGMPNDGDVFSVTINSTDPIWIYCSVPQHCQRGMAMVINPSDANTLDAYKSAASDSSSSSAPEEVTGGTFGAVSDSGSDSSATDTATDSSATMTSADSSPSATDASSDASGTESAGSAATTSAGAGGSPDAAGNVVAPLSFVLAAVMGGAALML